AGRPAGGLARGRAELRGHPPARTDAEARRAAGAGHAGETERSEVTGAPLGAPFRLTPLVGVVGILGAEPERQVGHSSTVRGPVAALEDVLPTVPRST